MLKNDRHGPTSRRPSLWSGAEMQDATSWLLTWRRVSCHGGQRRAAERLLASEADPEASPGYTDQTAAQIAAAPGTQRENLITWLQDRSR